MGDIKITSRVTRKVQNLNSSKRHEIRVRTKFYGHFLEVESAHFHHDSAVLLPDYGPFDSSEDVSKGRVTGLAVLRACYLFAQENPQKVILIAGHTDTSGDNTYNYKLSSMRADNILYALQGKRSAWVKNTRKKYKVKDYKLILTWIDKIWNWGCDPGAIDEKLDAKTRAAVKIFQRTYNKEFTQSIDVDGIVGTQTWGAFFDVYTRVLLYIIPIDKKGLDKMRRSLRFVSPASQIIGCGEDYPIDAPNRDKYRSPENRRVEILFFDSDHKPIQLTTHKATCAELYKSSPYELKPIKVKSVPLKPVKHWILCLLKAGSGPVNKRDPLKNESYVVTGMGGQNAEIKGKTDDDGILRVPVYEDSCTMKLKVAGLEFTLKGGDLPLIEAGDEAVKKRLLNLGYGKAKYESWDQDTYKSALTVFQKDHDQAVTGAVDAATRSKLKEMHGS